MTCPKASDGDVPICMMEFFIHEDDFQARPQNRSLIHATRLDQVKLKFENFIFYIQFSFDLKHCNFLMFLG